MSTQTTSVPTQNASAPAGSGVNPGFGKFLAGLILGLVVGLAAGAVLPTVLGIGGAAMGGPETPTPAAGQPRAKPKGPVMAPTQPVDQEPRQPVQPPEGTTPPAPGEQPKPAETKPAEPKPAEPASGAPTPPKG
jgi:hypothetical protein